MYGGGPPGGGQPETEGSLIGDEPDRLLWKKNSDRIMRP